MLEILNQCAFVLKMAIELLIVVSWNSLPIKVFLFFILGLCYIPTWMFKMLKFPEPGAPATVSLVPDLKKKSMTQYMIKLRPHRTKFI